MLTARDQDWDLSSRNKVMITWEKEYPHGPVIGQGEITVDINGNKVMNAPFKVPESASPGPHTVFALQSDGIRAVRGSVPYTVVAPALAGSPGGGGTPPPPIGGGTWNGVQGSPAIVTSPATGSQPVAGAGASVQENGVQTGAIPATAGQAAVPTPARSEPGASLITPVELAGVTVTPAEPGAVATPLLPPGQLGAADNRIAEGVQPSFSFAPGKATLGSGKAGAQGAGGRQSLIALVVAVGFAVSVAGVLLNDEFRRRKVRSRSAMRSEAEHS